MKFSVWISTREPRTWAMLSETIVLGALLALPAEATIRLVVGLPLLAHLAWSALTSLPAGTIPGRADGAEVRSNHHLRSRVVTFLTEVQRMEKYMRDARAAGLPTSEVRKNLQWADTRLQATTAEVVKALGRSDF